MGLIKLIKNRRKPAETEEREPVPEVKPLTLPVREALEAVSYT